MSFVSFVSFVWIERRMMRPLVLKFGGELLEDRAHLATVVAALSAIAGNGTPLVVVHGGGKEIDAALKAAGIEKRQVDGLRITDEATLDVVVSVLAGAVNTRLVAALNTAGVRARRADRRRRRRAGCRRPPRRIGRWTAASSISDASACRPTTPICRSCIR